MIHSHNNISAYELKMPFAMVFRIFADHDIFYCHPHHLEYYQILKEVFHHFFNCDSVEIYSYDKHMSFDEFKKLSDYTKKPYNSKIRLIKLLKPNKFKKKHITYSLLNIDKLDVSDDKIWTDERKFAIQSRGFKDDHLQIFLSMFENNDMFIDLKDSRSVITANNLIKNLELVQQSKFYFGAPCGWSKFAKWYNIPRYHTLNVTSHLVHCPPSVYPKKIDLLAECLY